MSWVAPPLDILIRHLGYGDVHFAIVGYRSVPHLLAAYDRVFARVGQGR